MEWWKEGVGKREGGKKVDWREVIFEDEKFGCFFFFFFYYHYCISKNVVP